jgi:hypothetical protein
VLVYLNDGYAAGDTAFPAIGWLSQWVRIRAK